MLVTELFEAFGRDHRLTLRTDPETPGALRLIDSESRELISLVRSPADFNRMLTNRRIVPGLNLIVIIPPRVYADHRQIIDNIISFSRHLDRAVKFQLASGQLLN